MSRHEPVCPMIVRDVSKGGFLRVNRSFVEQTGLDPERLRERSLVEWLHPEDRPAFVAFLERGHGRVRARHQVCPEGWISLRWDLRSEERGQVLLGLFESEESAETTKDSSHKATARPDTMSATLDAMVHVVEANNPGLKCSVLLLDDDGRRVSVGSGPSLPASYNGAVEGLAIGPSVGSCGTAAYWNVPVIVEDIERDPLWKDLKAQARRAGLGACWSHPIAGSAGRALGALALYSPSPRRPTEEELSRLETAARMVGLAVERGRAERALRLSESEAQIQSRLLGSITEVMTFFVDKGDWPTAGERLVRAAVELTKSQFGFLVDVKEGEVSRVSARSLVFREDQQGVDPEGEKNGRVGKTLSRLADLEPLLEQVAASGQLVAESEPFLVDRNENANPSSANLLVRSFLGSPISRRGEVVALIAVVNSPEGYSEEESRVVQALCRAGSVLFDSHYRRERESALEEKLRHAGKMEALGVLAGGIAHDFNNMLTVILGNAELAMATLHRSAEAQGNLEEIVTASRQATELCNQMLAYAGRGALWTEGLECRELILELGALLQVALPKKAILEYQFVEEPLYIEADRTQLRQVMMNLITNAGEALGNDVGRIVVEAGTAHFSSDELELLQPESDLPSGEYVQLRVCDTGAGMTAETQARIFDPFFTTKFTGRGLGLAVVKGIVLRHAGAVFLESRLGQGTRFTVLLPRVQEPRGSDPVLREPVPGQAGRRVLIVDDEPQVRTVTGEMLHRAGFEVLQASDGEEAISIFSRESDRIDCVLLDLSMPKLDGEETFQELRKIRGDVKVVLSSGFSEQETLDRFRGAGFADVLQKPAARKTLIAKLHEAIGRV